MIARERAIDVLGLLAFKGALSAWVLACGFTHVSDDDYARVVIAELFAHAPKLDPSGTSWLPFPFWALGGVMLAAGRSLGTARVVACAMGAAAVVVVYLALRAAGVKRVPAVVGVALAMATPWSVWLGVATVPEAITAALVALGAMGIAARRARAWAAVALLAASLSRYEAWPVCAVFACACAVSALRRGAAAREARVDLAAAVIGAAGPLLWMAWNAHAHGSALHFFARVAAFRQAGGFAEVPLAEKILGFPRALVTGAPSIAIVAALGALGLSDPAVRARWTGPLVAAAAVLAFLVVGDVRDGAPTHHPERALLGVWTILATFGADGVAAVVTRVAWGRPKREAWAVAFAVAALIGWSSGAAQRLADYPSRAANERRDAQVARGLDLRARDVAAIAIAPCAYEHFAVLAAWGAPERAETLPATGGEVSERCPRIAER